MLWYYPYFWSEFLVSTDYNQREILKQMRIKNATKIIISHLNINSIRNKFDCLTYLIDKNVDILVISESKLDSTFPDIQFFIHGFHSPYQRARNDKGGGLLLYVRDHIPSRKRKIDFCTKIESIVGEINLNKKKWLIISSYNPQKSMISNHLNTMTATFEFITKSMKIS